MKTQTLIKIIFMLALMSSVAFAKPDDLVIAVIDTGLDINHPDLKAQLWTNPGEIPNNGIDDDNNGFVDDIHGWNFANNSNDLTDSHGHGTHIAGIIAGHSPDLPRVSSQVKIMALKYYDPKSSGAQNLINSIRALMYAIDMKAKIINYSGGGVERSQLEEAAIKKASRNGILLVAAAGNESTNTDNSGYYPANYKLPNIISVASIDMEGHLLSFSNYGAKTVDLATRGKNIYSTLPDGKYGMMSGTSQSTALMTGIAAHMMLQNRDLIGQPKKVLRALIDGGKKDLALIGKTKYRVSLDPTAALSAL
jgi:subtilisin family serine protease